MVMNWLLAHRPADAKDAVRVVLEAPSSAEAIAMLRSQIPEEHKILFVMATDQTAPAT